LGPRRAGKSTFLKESFKDFDYITLDDLDYLDLAEKDPKALFTSKKVIIDEIQRVPKLTIAAKYVIDEKGATVMMSGSSRIGLLDATADSLAGRIDILEMPPSCWGESDGPPTHSIFDDEVPTIRLKEAHRKLEDFLTFGGFPEVVSATDKNTEREILNNYKNTYFTRDLSLLSNIEDVSGLRAILLHYAHSIGSITQVANFQNEANISHVTTKKYLNSIYQAGLGFTLTGYQYGPAKRHIKGAKSYFCDNGVITALDAQCSRGQMIENFVISELEKRRKLGFYKTDQFHFYKSTSGFEIDLIIEEKQKLKAIEIKSSQNPATKDFRSLEEFVNVDPKKRQGFLFYMGTDYKKIGKILCIPMAAIYRGR